VPPRVTVEKLSSVDVERQVLELVGAEVPLATVEPVATVAEVEVAAVEDDHGLGGQFAVDEPDPG